MESVAASPDHVAPELAAAASELLPDDLKDALLARARHVKIRRGQMIIAEGTLSQEVYLICSGRLQVSVLSLGGWETIFRDQGPGELVGELAAIDGDERSASVIALEDGLLACLTATQFRDFLSEVPRAGFWMARQLTARVRNLSARAFEMATLPVSGRLLAELLRLPSSQSGDQREIAAMPIHSELAARIGTHRETVTRELRALARQGLVQQSGRALQIPSAKKLEALLQSQRR